MPITDGPLILDWRELAASMSCDDRHFVAHLPLLSASSKFYAGPISISLTMFFTLWNTLAFITTYSPCDTKNNIPAVMYNFVLIPIIFCSVHYCFAAVWSGSIVPFIPRSTKNPSSFQNVFMLFHTYAIEHATPSQLRQLSQVAPTNPYWKYAIHIGIASFIVFGYIVTLLLVISKPNYYNFNNCTNKFFVASLGYLTITASMIVSGGAIVIMTKILFRIAIIINCLIQQWQDRYVELRRVSFNDLKAMFIGYDDRIGWKKDGNNIKHLNFVISIPPGQSCVSNNSSNMGTSMFNQSVAVTDQDACNQRIDMMMIARRIRRDAYERYLFMQHFFLLVSKHWSWAIGFIACITGSIFIFYVVITVAILHFQRLDLTLFWIICSCALFFFPIVCVGYANRAAGKFEEFFLSSMPGNSNFYNDSIDTWTTADNNDIRANDPTNPLLGSQSGVVELKSMEPNKRKFADTSNGDFLVIGGRDEWLAFIGNSKLEWKVLGFAITPKTLQALLATAATAILVTVIPAISSEFL